MPRKKSEVPLQKVTLYLFQGDMSWLQGRFPHIGASVAIRKLVRQFRKDIEFRSRDNASISIDDIDVEEPN